MTLSLLGIQYICENFGDTSLCCARTGLSWYYTVGTTDYPETGGTAQIVSRLASGLIDSLTMTSPPRGTFTKAQLDAANESTVTILDAKEITYHDEPTEVQWCFIPCSDHTTQVTCELYGCFWWNGACHDLAPSCEALLNEPDCTRYGCYWYNGSCHTSLPTCEELNNQPDCLLYECFWYNGACHSAVVCENILVQTECEAHGCYWYNGACHSAVVCENILVQTECEAHGCFWWNGACHSLAPSCEALLNEPDCTRYGCYWFRGECHTVDQLELCYWIDDQGGPNALTITNVFTIIDAYTLSTPPTGYTFVPTIVNVFGVVDYFLGFDGDAKTGCDYYL